MRLFFGTLVAAALGAALATPAASHAAEHYTPVTKQRLLHPEPRNWLLYRGNYAGWGFSPLAQIDVKNVKHLKLAWSSATGMNEGHEAPPIVNDGFMFVTTPNNQVIAFEAKSGKELWRYKKTIPDEMLQLHPTNRGVALWGKAVYFGTTDAFVVALDAETGKELWKTAIGDWKAGYYITLAPLAIEGKILVGSSGGELGVRGFVAALDAETGKEIWRTYTIPGKGEPGYESWPEGMTEHGGAPVWLTGTYDPETNLTYWGTGNAGPWTAELRPGDNLYSSSVLALNASTGEIKGYHQYQWNESWDWDEVSPPLLLDVKRGGKPAKTLVHAGRNGYLWLLEPTPSRINFLDAWPFVAQNVFASVDPDSGRPTYAPEHVMKIGKTVSYCPSTWGGKNWPPEAYSPRTGLFYVPAHNNLCSEMTYETPKYVKGELYIGVPLESVLKNVRMAPEAKDHIGELQAWNLETKKQVWMHKFPEMNWGPLLATGGDLLFAGGTNDRKFRAFDAKSGKVLWEYPASSGVTGIPTSFEVDGEQYVAVESGWGVDAQRMQDAFDAVLDHKTVVPKGGTVMVFKLEKE